jgi:dipeptidyl aminopeptidase/acylaminoacyl peptidase
VLSKAEHGDVLLYTEESYATFPDLWTSSIALDARHRVSEVNPELASRDLGSAELIEWSSLDGDPLQGVLIKPAGYQPGQRVPVLVYFYRFFSQRLHEFNEPKVNHRPSFPVYATDGYAIFLPDIRFEVGRPGIASVKSLVPGVQKLIDMGIADPEAIGLHGHSWSGYQTAYIVTQTDLFAAAIAGAPVANMTSAYSGIRWSSGMARQFQYEQSQSRIGAPLWEKPQLYIENSPVFYADRISTPLLIIHGDEDGAVPWYQSIELYLALRRLAKPTVFLQYRGEDHHPEKYANKLDWSIKMKEFLDHHLKGAPAPVWWSEGIPYSGK